MSSQLTDAKVSGMRKIRGIMADAMNSAMSLDRTGIAEAFGMPEIARVRDVLTVLVRLADADIAREIEDDDIPF